PRGGGRASARETVARVAAGAIARKLLAETMGAEVLGYVVRVGEIEAAVAHATLEAVEHFADGSPNPVRCPDHAAARQMIAVIEQARRDRDSIGGVATIEARGIVAGLGEPVFDKLKADLAK